MCRWASSPTAPPADCPKDRKDPAFHTKPALAWQLIAEARAAGIPFRLVVADSVYGENATLEAQLFAAQIPYVMGLRPSHGPWQEVEDARHPAGLHPRRGGAAPPAVRLAAHRAIRQPWQGARTLRRRARVGHGLRADPRRAPDRRDPRPSHPHARVDLVPGHLLAARPRSAPRRSTKSTACAIGSSTITSQSSTSWAGPTTSSVRNGRLSATGSW